MTCAKCRWSHLATSENGENQKLECRYEVKLVAMQTRMHVAMKSALTKEAIPVQEHIYGTMFPGVKPDWWCSHFEQDGEVVN